MAGTFKKFKAALCLDIVNCSDEATFACGYDGSKTHSLPISFLDTSGNSVSGIQLYNCGYARDTKRTTNTSTFAGVEAVGTADALASYDFNDYQVTSVVTTTQTSTLVGFTTGAKRILSVTFNNASGESEVVVNCIKLQRKIRNQSGSEVYVLVGAYYLDTPITIQAGETSSLILDLKVSSEVSVS